MALGKYTVPADENKAGQDNCKGTGSCGQCQGLQVDFAKELASAIDEAKSKYKATIILGYSGFVAKSSAEDWAKNGNGVFLSEIKLYGWGLAAEIQNGQLNGGTMSPGAPFTDDVKKLLKAHGLRYVATQGHSYIRPENVNFDNSATGCTYGDSGSTTTSDGVANGSSASVSSIAYYFANQFQSVQEDAQSLLLQGDRALANDKPLFGYVADAVKSSMRTFTTSPKGEFIAWYPDFWGIYDDEEGGSQSPYLELEDIELKDLTISQSDANFYTHCYCPGKDVTGRQVDIQFTQGVVSVESPIEAKASSAQQSAMGESTVSDEVSPILSEILSIPEGEEWKYTPKELYRRYGARPHQVTTNAIENQGEGAGDDYENNPQYIIPFLSALYDFMEQWSSQYTVNLSLTFMPELFPGARIKVKSLGLTVYVKSVQHNMSYTNGFTTTATCTCPAGTLLPGMIKPDLMGSSMVNGDKKDFS